MCKNNVRFSEMQRLFALKEACLLDAQARGQVLFLAWNHYLYTVLHSLFRATHMAALSKPLQCNLRNGLCQSFRFPPTHFISLHARLLNEGGIGE